MYRHHSMLTLNDEPISIGIYYNYEVFRLSELYRAIVLGENSNPIFFCFIVFKK